MNAQLFTYMFSRWYKAAFLLLLYATCSSAQTTESFLNFGKIEQLSTCTQQTTSNCYELNNAQRLLVSKSKIIVKTSLNADSWKKRFPELKKAQTLAILENSSLQLLSFQDEINVFEMAMQLSQLKAVEYAQPDVLLMQTERALKRTDNSHTVYKQFNLDHVWSITKGKGARIAIIDDGFALENAVFSETDIVLTYDADNMVLDASHKDGKDNHGTPMASIIFAKHQEQIKGIAPEASLLAIRQVDMWSSHMIVAIYVAHLSGADVINGSWTLPYIVEPFYDTLTHFIHSGRNKKGGVALFASGNGRHKPINSVCGIDGVLCVGAANNNGNITPYTRRAKTLDLLAPSPLPSLHVKQPYYRRSGGTSSSTAFVSGVAALLISVNPKIRGDMVHSILVESTKRLAGYPLIQPYKVIRKGLDLE